MRKVLFIDLNVDLLLAMNSFLTREGFSALTSSSYEEGYSLLMSFHPDIVFIDTSDERQSFLFYQKLAAELRFRAIRIVFTKAQNRMLSLYPEKGLTFITKPFQMSDLSFILRKE